MRLFGSERMQTIVGALGLEEDQPIEHKMLTNAIESAQKKVEGHNFQIRKHVLQYDDVMNLQREVIYGQRQKVLNGENVKDSILKMLRDVVAETVERFSGGSDVPDEWNITSMTGHLEKIYLPQNAISFTREELEDLTKEDLIEKLTEIGISLYKEKEEEFSSEGMRELERIVLLRVVDSKWMDHIDAMDQLRHGINLRAYAQRDPVVEYKFEGYNMFEEMVATIREETLMHIFHARLETPLERKEQAKPQSAKLDGEDEKKPVKTGEKIGRNDLCPCGSGKKYKKCCGAAN